MTGPFRNFAPNQRHLWCRRTGGGLERMSQLLNQKDMFQARLKRIDSGSAFEHHEVLGKSAQRKVQAQLKVRERRAARPGLNRLMMLFAFLCGVVSIFLGQLSYFHLAQVEGLPDSFYDLGGRGMVLFGLVIAGVLAGIFHLTGKMRLPALLLGGALMHFGAAALAANAPELWAELFSPDYAAEMIEKGRDYLIQPAG